MRDFASLLESTWEKGCVENGMKKRGAKRRG
jgi:hypothetical protein